MARRTLASHGAFFRPFLWPGARVLDCGCGPGSITAGLAGCVAPGGTVSGIDVNRDQVEIARQRLQGLQGVPGVELRVANIYDLPFGDAQFDVVFSHALFEHLVDPQRAAREVFRVLKPGGVVGIRSPDWSGVLAGPSTPELDLALQHYADVQAANGGNLRVGRTLGAIVGSAGFSRIRIAARYECYAPAAVIGEYLARQIARAEHAAALRAWYASPDAFFAQSWCEVVAAKVTEG